MTWSATFEVTEVQGNEVVARASALPAVAPNSETGEPGRNEYGTLTQNTERAVRMTLVIELEPGAVTQLKPGDQLQAHGHFAS